LAILVSLCRVLVCLDCPDCTTTSDCSNRFPEGGYCSINPVLPFCPLDIPRCSPTSPCTCCRNCHDIGCSTEKQGWQCVNTSTAETLAQANITCVSDLCKAPPEGSPCSCCPTVTTCRDPECEETLKGQCIPKGNNGPSNYRKSQYTCTSLSSLQCECWIPKCSSSECVSVGGKCFHPEETVPPHYQETDIVCDKESQCKCFIEKCHNTQCDKLNGTCFKPQDYIPSNYKRAGFFCNRDMNCHCYIKRCTHPICDLFDGLCLLPGEPVPLGYHLFPHMCDKERGCQCYVQKCPDECLNVSGICVFPDDPEPEPPQYKEIDVFCDGCRCLIKECLSSKCDKLNGICILPGETIPDNYLKSGIVCDEDRKCECYVEFIVD